MVVKYSIEQNQQNLHPKEFVSVPTIPLQTWVDGYRLKLNSYKFFLCENCLKEDRFKESLIDNLLVLIYLSFYYRKIMLIALFSRLKISQLKISRLKIKKTPITIDGFNMSFFATRQSCKIANEDVISEIWKDEMNFNNWMLSKCSCSTFAKYYFCKHLSILDITSKLGGNFFARYIEIALKKMGKKIFFFKIIIASFELITGFLGFSISSTSESLSSFCAVLLTELMISTSDNKPRAGKFESIET
ncbi:hypothetical protein BpHYR1_039731 [Brachionus plicatilis]|uniref:SWIM-type domain-containing protein n=1 Tax=Brachionus plicatilis TaxID=10195 RepID=A0A3M7T5X5_BRAPC|nr:hypothetical protein BpHYR1_039731 [Brachionus plicatilis]